MRLWEEEQAQQAQLHLRKKVWVDRNFLAEQQANPVSTHTEKTERSGWPPEIIACFFVLVYPTCSAGQAKTVADLEVFIAVNDVLLMERDSTVHWMVNN